MFTFNDRLKNYRLNTCKLSTKKEMAEYLGISQQLYAMVERGDREPSKKFLEVLVNHSKLDESYWLFGIENTHINKTSNLYFTEHTVHKLINDGFIDRDVNLDEDVKELILTSLKADIKSLFFNKNK